MSASGPITRNIPVLALRADVARTDSEKRTADVTWTSGARVLRSPWFGEPYLEELSLDPKHVRMDRLASGRAPVLDTHQRYSLKNQIGVVDRASIGAATLRFSKRDEVTPVWNDIQDRIIGNVSFGYIVHKYDRMPPGADGGDPKLPVYRAVDWEPFEVSPVPVPADGDAAFRSVDGDEARTNPCTLIFRGEEKRTMEPTTTPKPEVTPAPAPAQQPPSTEAQRAHDEQIRTEELARVDGIQRAVRAAKLGQELEDKLVKDRVPLDKARAMVLEKLADQDEQVRTTQHVRADRVEVTDDAADKWQRGAMAQLLARSGEAKLIQAAAKAQPDNPYLRGLELDPGEFRGMTLVEMARDCLERAGVKTRGLSKMELVGKAFTHRSSGMASTSDFPVLLENVLHKVLQAAYAMAEDTWRRFCAIGTVSDFRAHNRYRLGSFGALDTVAEGGEFKYKAIPDGEKGSITASTKGNLIALTRQAIINDDLGQFTSLAARLGRAAALSIESDVYTLLALAAGLGPTLGDSLTLFHATHANIGTGAALSITSIDLDRQFMASQKDPAGKEYLSLRPAVLLVPLALGGAARVINGSQYDVDPVTTNATNMFQKPNKVAGLFRDIVDTPRLTGTRRYMFADPGIAPVIEVAFLDGNQGPYMETQEGWNIDGTSWKVRIDYGVGAVDFRGAVTNAGT